jgi:hypothetical protein
MVKYKWSIIRTEAKTLWDAETLPEKPELQKMIKSIGGYIEKIPKTWLKNGVRVMYVNEEGRLYGMPHNPVASELLNNGELLVGDVVVQWQETMDRPTLINQPLDPNAKLPHYDDYVKQGILSGVEDVPPTGGMDMPVEGEYIGE